MEFPIDDFKGKIETSIGKTISFLKVFGEQEGSEFIPMVFWLKTSDNICSRFFIDAWILHWYDYTQNEMKEIIEEDSDEFGTVIDLMLDNNLKNRVIQNIEMDYINEGEDLIGQLEIEIENKLNIKLSDFGDKKEQTLKIKTL